jgi:hypothetical protein
MSQVLRVGMVAAGVSAAMLVGGCALEFGSSADTTRCNSKPCSCRSSASDAPLDGTWNCIEKVCQCNDTYTTYTTTGGTSSTDQGDSTNTGGGPVTPVTKTFEPCGGEPFGEWKLQDLDASAMKLYFSSLGTVAGNCPETVTEAPQNPQFHLLLQSGGSGQLYISQLDFVFSPTLECVQRYLGSDHSCNFGGDQQCSGVGSACYCSQSWDPTFASGTWTRSDSVLTVGTVSMAYCVRDDVLKLQDSDGFIYTLVRAFHLGTPTSCDSRTVSECETDSGCHLGACSGGDQCTAATAEPNCTNISGCSWNANVCRGTAASKCEFSSYGVVPGCELTTVPPICVGTPTPCAQLTIDACEGTQGCSLQAANH